jgi:hypothetical protein
VKAAFAPAVIQLQNRTIGVRYAKPSKTIGIVPEIKNARAETQMRIATFVIGVLVAIGSPTALAQPAPRPASDAETAAARDQFERDVRPLLVRRCYQCHSTQAKKQKGELTLDTRDGLLRGGSRGTLFVAGQTDASLLLAAIGYQDDELQMPPSGKLPDEEIAVLNGRRIRSC